MKIVAINGSPRGKMGNTYIMVEEFLKGARDAGADVEHILLADKKIHHCIGCFSCWIKTPGVCAFNDDMRDILPKLLADVLVYATPLYIFNVTGIMKNFMDRQLPLVDPHLERDSIGETRHADRYGKTPKLVIISNCGFPEQTHFDGLKALFKCMARNTKAEIIAEIYRGEGELLKANSIFLKPVLSKYKKLLQRCGREVVENGRLSEDTKTELEKPLISYESYTEHANKHWDKELAKIAR